MNADLVWVNGFNAALVEAMVKDVSPDQWRLQPAGLPNHAAWQIGHLTFVRVALAGLLGKPGPVSADVVARFGPGSEPESVAVAGSDKEALMHLFRTSQAHIAGLLPTLTEEVLSAPTPVEAFRTRFPLTRNLVFGLLTAHDALHIGQLGSWRRAIGLPRVL